MSPLCQTQIAPDKLNEMEPFFPLHVYVCSSCYLVQLEEFVKPEVIFGAGSPYYSSYSDSWVAHAKRYVDHVRDQFKIGSRSLVVEIASNDGYLLQHLVKAGVPCLGIEPDERGTAEATRARGVRTITQFFGVATALSVRSSEKAPADLILGNNVLAHVPDLNDFVEGVRVLLRHGWDSRLSSFPTSCNSKSTTSSTPSITSISRTSPFTTVERVFEAHGMRLFDVKELDTHGGSIRIYACHAQSQSARRAARLSKRSRIVRSQRGLSQP